MPPAALEQALEFANIVERAPFRPGLSPRRWNGGLRPCSIVVLNSLTACAHRSLRPVLVAHSSRPAPVARPHLAWSSEDPYFPQTHALCRGAGKFHDAVLWKARYLTIILTLRRAGAFLTFLWRTGVRLRYGEGDFALAQSEIGSVLDHVVPVTGEQPHQRLVAKGHTDAQEHSPVLSSRSRPACGMRWRA